MSAAKPWWRSPPRGLDRDDVLVLALSVGGHGDNFEPSLGPGWPPWPLRQLVLFVVYGREATRIDGNDECLTSIVIGWGTSKYGTDWLHRTWWGVNQLVPGSSPAEQPHQERCFDDVYGAESETSNFSTAQTIARDLWFRCALEETRVPFPPHEGNVQQGRIASTLYALIVAREMSLGNPAQDPVPTVRYRCSRVSLTLVSALKTPAPATRGPSQAVSVAG